ncbi:MAG: ATPase, T2SS/T4P/T4SS family [Candidatus Omnitrophota bacterium]
MAGDKKIKRLGDVLVEQGLISSEQLKLVLEEQRQSGHREMIGHILVDKGWITPEQLNMAVASQSGTTKVDIVNYVIEPDILKLVPEQFAHDYKVVPLFRIENTLTVAMADPSNIYVIDALQRQTNCSIEPTIASEMEILRVIDRFYGISSSLRNLINSIDQKKILTGEVADEAPVIKIVNMLIVQAVRERASDIHIEPEEKSLNIRYRVDGILHTAYTLPKMLQLPITSRVKIISNLDIAEKRLPQDGRIKMVISNRDIDFRVSLQPTVHGENIVLRVLDKSSLMLGMDQLGFNPEELKLFEEMLSRPYGIILVTGPTGSGKTTTLYSALERLNEENVNIMTIEDPVEYQLSRVRQTQVHPKINLTFATGLRAILRQDPDIVMVGEIRDVETAEIAVQAALTGHLVFSTLHTNDAASAFTRLIDMGVEPFLVSSSLAGVLAQRLVRKVCPKCRESFKPSLDLIEQLGIKHLIKPGTVFWRGTGCRFCKDSGYKGRMAIYEVLMVNADIERLVLQKASSDTIRDFACKQLGLKLLRDSALQKLIEGVTTPEEVMRVTREI